MVGLVNATTSQPSAADPACNYQPARVSIDAVPNESFACILDPTEDWNGWACPHFTKEEGLRIVEMMARFTSEPARFEDEADRFVFVVEGADYIYRAEMINGEKRYAIGAWGWCWSIEHDPIDHPAADTLRVRVVVNGGVAWSGPLAEFFDDNADGIDETQREVIRCTLAAVGSYKGGGGADAEYVVECVAASTKGQS